MDTQMYIARKGPRVLVLTLLRFAVGDNNQRAHLLYEQALHRANKDDETQILAAAAALLLEENFVQHMERKTSNFFEAWMQLPPMYRLAYTLKYMEFDEVTVANILHCSVAAARAQVQRSVEKMKRVFVPEPGAPEQEAA